ncbi:MAG: hypothetical protein EWM51_03700 [Treponema sp.]|nr:MAG: hypothetical protein EWM51_03700 [Treponema sp.]
MGRRPGQKENDNPAEEDGVQDVENGNAGTSDDTSTVAVVFQKTCAGPNGTFFAGQRSEISEQFARALESDNAIKRI